MIPPVSVCHQLSWIGRPKASTPQRTASGFSGSPTLAMNRRSGHGCSCAQLVPGSHHHPHRGRGGVPDGDSFGLQQLVPADRVEVRLVDHARHAERERSEDAVRHPRHPSWVGRAPEDVVVVEVERPARGCAVRGDRLVHVDGALGHAGRPAREVQQAPCLSAQCPRRGRCSPLERGAGAGRARRSRSPLVVDHDHVAQPRQLRRGSVRSCAGRGRSSSRARGRRPARGAVGSARARTPRTAHRRRCRGAGCPARRCTARARGPSERRPGRRGRRRACRGHRRTGRSSRGVRRR